MSIRFHVDTTALRPLLQRLSPRRRLRAQRAALQNGAYRIELGAKRRAPVRTGFLRSSIRALDAEPDSCLVVVGAEYGRFVEFGTSRQPARSYLRSTLHEDRGEINRAVVEALRRWAEGERR